MEEDQAEIDCIFGRLNDLGDEGIEKENENKLKFNENYSLEEQDSLYDKIKEDSLFSNYNPNYNEKITEESKEDNATDNNNENKNSDLEDKLALNNKEESNNNSTSYLQLNNNENDNNNNNNNNDDNSDEDFGFTEKKIEDIKEKKENEKDWNGIFQKILSSTTNTSIERIKKAIDLSQLINQFIEEAIPIAKILVDERNMFEEAKTIKSVNSGGIAGGEKVSLFYFLFLFQIIK